MTGSVDQLLARYPQARIAALFPDGRPTTVPEGLPLGPEHIATVTAGLAGYQPEDRPGVLAAFDRALQHGVSHARARTVTDPTVPLGLHLVDATEEHGVVLVVIAVEDSDTAAAPAEVLQTPVVAPRVIRMKKAQTGLIVDVDPGAEAILGWTRSEIVGRRSLEFIHPADQPVAIENWLHLAAHPEQTVRSRLRHQAQDGSWVWFESSQSYLDGADAPLILTELVDVTAEMAAQQELAAREQLLRQLTHSLPVGVLQIDRTGRLTYSNERLFHILGVNRIATVGQLLDALRLTDRNLLAGALQAVFDGNAERSCDVQLVDAAGEPGRTCAFSLRPLLDDGQVVAVVGSVTDVTDGFQLRRELEHRATTDSLTGCLNREAILAHLDGLRAAATEAQPCITVAYVDLDHFKSVNDRLGHSAGDDLLRHSVNRLAAAAGPNAVVGRLGGDEFLVVRTDVSPDGAHSFAAALTTAVEQPIVIGGQLLTPGLSVGVVCEPHPGVSTDALVARADAAMYAVKRAQRPALSAASAALATPRRGSAPAQLSP